MGGGRHLRLDDAKDGGGGGGERGAELHPAGVRSGP